MTDLDKLDALAAAATPGPWIRKWASLDVHAMSGDGVLLHQENIDFAVALVNEYATIRDLVAAVRERDELRAALLSEDGVAHGEAYEPSRGGLGVCAYCDDEWPCHTQRAIDRALDREAEASE